MTQVHKHRESFCFLTSETKLWRILTAVFESIRGVGKGTGENITERAVDASFMNMLHRNPRQSKAAKNFFHTITEGWGSYSKCAKRYP